MSVWIYCGDTEKNITYNLQRMFNEAFAANNWLNSLDKKSASDVLEIIDAAIMRMIQDPEKYKEMDAPNGWGTYKDALPWLIDLRQGLAREGNEIIEMSR